jgi:hypothetical protein
VRNAHDKLRKLCVKVCEGGGVIESKSSSRHRAANGNGRGGGGGGGGSGGGGGDASENKRSSVAATNQMQIGDAAMRQLMQSDWMAHLSTILEATLAMVRDISLRRMSVVCHCR